MEYSAICHFADKRWCFALEKGRFLFLIKVKKDDIQRVVLYYQDKYLPPEVRDTRASVEMVRVASDSVSDYFEAELTFQMICLRYYFLLEDMDGEQVYYGNYTFQEEPFTDVERMFDCPQNLREEEMVQPPVWAEGRVAYQIFPTRFASHRPVDEALWYKAPIRQERLGGTLRGIIDRLDHLETLGVDLLYMTPIFLAETEHKYDVIDYYKVDPSLGAEADLRELVDKAHARGMRVMLDGVFNHTSTKFFAFADILEKQEKSAYLDWYFIDDFPLRIRRGGIPNFKTFGYAGMMPKLNLRNPAVEDYFLQVGAYWVREFDIDGWRLDVADEVGHRFWRRFREAVRAVKPDVLLVGEEWHYAGDFLQGEEWDSAMNYPFYNAVLDLVARQSITVSEFMEQLGFLQGNYHPATVRQLWNLIDSHDTPRFLYSAGGDHAKQRMAAALQLLLPGVPMICYGDEFAIDGGPDPDCRRGMVWDENRQDGEMFAWYRQLIALRRAHPCLARGRVSSWHADDESGLILLTVSDGEELLSVFFHCQDASIILPLGLGETDLLRGVPFNGSLGPWDAVVLG